MKIEIVRTSPTKKNLKDIYDTMNKIFKEDKFFYTNEEVSKLKKNNKNVFL